MSTEETWLNENLCSLAGDTVRIELGPQLVDLPCDDSNLNDYVTAPHYKIGGRDAKGRRIRPTEMPERTAAEAAAKAEAIADPLGAVHKGSEMAVVDWRNKFKAPVWKLYQLQEVTEEGEEAPVQKFIKVEEFPDFDAALVAARKLAA